MTRVLTDKQFWEGVIKANHKPFIRDIGSQREPEMVVVCSCEHWSTNVPYTDHLIEILEKEFGLFNDQN